jgi:glyoxylase-like metal-dependent hydrolase (beta-lactamase superfamily II)
MISIIPLLKGVPITGSGGALGWSSVTLILKDNYKVLVDTGFHGNRHYLLQALKDNNVDPHEINEVVLTHMHFDHCLNYDLFPSAKFILSKSEYDYVLNGGFHQSGDMFIPDVLDKIEKRGLRLFENKLELEEGIYCLLTPGHTPGSATVIVDYPNEVKTAICGDLFKYAWEVNLIDEIPQGTFGKVEDLKASQRKILISA